VAGLGVRRTAVLIIAEGKSLLNVGEVLIEDRVKVARLTINGGSPTWCMSRNRRSQVVRASAAGTSPALIAQPLTMRKV
jgi:hypothetical protein